MSTELLAVLFATVLGPYPRTKSMEGNTNPTAEFELLQLALS